MKTLTLLFLITINFSIYAQKSIFVRVYNSSGIKISSGHVLIVTDSSLQLAEDQSNVIPLSSIGYIKTKRSGGNNILIGSAVGAAAGTILGAISSSATKNYSSNSWNIQIYDQGAGTILVGMAGGLIGAGVGGLTILSKKSKTYFVNGDLTKWKAFQLMLFNNTVK